MKSPKPAAPRADAMPTEGFAIAVDGKLKLSYPTSEAAFLAGLEIKRKFPVVQVSVYDATTKERTLVEAPAPAAET